MVPGAYYSVYQAPGYISNYQRINVLKMQGGSKNDIAYQTIDSVPMVPILDEGQLALSLTWGNQWFDMDIVVEFDVSPEVKCRVNFANRECGSVRMVLDNSMDQKRSTADVVFFDQVDRETLYLVYVNLNTLRMRQKPKSPSFDLSKGVLKVYAPFYDWPVLQLQAP